MDMTQKELEALNRKFEVFGYHEGPGGRVPRFAWKRAFELLYLVQDGTREVMREGSPIILVLPTYRKTSWAERLGDIWVAAYWKAPMPEDQWIDRYGSLFPWPKNGLYYPMTDLTLDPGMVPDEGLTDLFVAIFRDQMETPYEQARDGCERAARGEVRQAATEFADAVNDWWPAFGNVTPGVRGHDVSFGGL